MIQLRDAITIASILVAVLSVILVSRNARRATAVQMQNADLTRIRDMRAEMRELKGDLTEAKTQVIDLSAELDAANERCFNYARREVEMIQYAHMPGVTIEDFRHRYGTGQDAIDQQRS